MACDVAGEQAFALGICLGICLLEFASWNLGICLSSSQKNGNSLTWVLVALTVCFTYPVLYRVSAESQAGEWEL